MFLAIAQLAIGVPLLMVGAEWLVRHASRLALAIGVSALVVGLTVVAYGTSAPELAVTVFAALRGDNDLAIGNVFGSNIANILLVLGLAAVLGPLTVNDRAVHVNIGVMILVTVLLTVLIMDSRLSHIDGAILFTVAIVYTIVAILFSRRSRVARAKILPESESVTVTVGQSAVSVIFIVMGVALLIMGARLMVTGASTLAEWLGISPLVIGLTIVAVGTSLPELATSCWAAVRGHRDIAVGNAVGSNIINIVGILGITGLSAPAGVVVDSDAICFDLPVMVAVAVASLPVLLIGHKLTRWEGTLFLMYYGAYVVGLYARAVGWFPSSQLAWYLAGVSPIVVVTLSVLAHRLLLLRNKGDSSAAV